MPRLPIGCTCILLCLWTTGCAWFRGASPSRTTLPRAVMNPIERDYKNLVALDNETLSEIAKWHHENRAKLKTDKAFQFDFIRLCRERLIKVKVAYEQFLASHPNHTRARAAYASFLQNVRDEQGAIDQ